MALTQSRRASLATVAVLGSLYNVSNVAAVDNSEKIQLGSSNIPTLIAGVPPVVVNRCSSLDLSGFTKSRNCGSPLSSPCFDLSRCRNGPTVYVYDLECSLADSYNIKNDGHRHSLVRQAARDAGMLADTYESACFFMNVEQPFQDICAPSAPLWNEGSNHVMFDVADEPRDQRPIYSNSYAMEASTGQRTCYYRSGFDVSIGHVPVKPHHELQSTPPENRMYFLTFKGSLYWHKYGSEERSVIKGLHDDANGIVVAERCRQGNFGPFPAYAQWCSELLPRYEAYDFNLLMNTTYGLVPAGGSPGTYRLAEVMSAGCVPVIVARDWVKPFPELVDWPAFSFTFSPDEVPYMVEALRAVPPEELKEMQKKSIEAYWKIYGGKSNYSWMASLVLKIIAQRIEHHRT